MPKILVVDDDRAIAELVSDALEDEGLSTVLALSLIHILLFGKIGNFLQSKRKSAFTALCCYYPFSIIG